MKKLIITAVNSLLVIGIVLNSAVFAVPGCSKSSECPDANADCNRATFGQYLICQKVGTGCCQWLKEIYHYVPVEGHNCTLPDCGQWSGDPAEAGTWSSGTGCSGGNDGSIHQGYCD